LGVAVRAGQAAAQAPVQLLASENAGLARQFIQVALEQQVAPALVIQRPGGGICRQPVQLGDVAGDEGIVGRLRLRYGKDGAQARPPVAQIAGQARDRTVHDPFLVDRRGRPPLFNNI
jgi:hypothetical protein